MSPRFTVSIKLQKSS